MSPTQQERTEGTTAALVEAGRELFAQDGFAATSLDDVVAKAGVTKGALYHHFSGKRDLFAAVFAAEQVRLSGVMVTAYQRGKDPWEAFEAGAAAFIEACQEPGVQRIFLLDAGAALGWETIRHLESSSLRMMEIGIRRAIEAGSIEDRPIGPLAHLLFGAICESAMVVARAADQEEALEEALDELHRLLSSLAV
ncbi:MAG: TetR/AcrR family transcriptional regulator [Solirubrobacterales bacterium]